MREDLLRLLKCPLCASTTLVLDKIVSDSIEIRGGRALCRKCLAEFSIEEGIINFLNKANVGVLRERKAMDEDEYISDDHGVKYRITPETINKFEDKLRLLPEGDGSYLFKRGGSFQSTAEAADRFYRTMLDMRLTGKENILEIGACFSYASAKFAKAGCSVVAMDISNYLKAADILIREVYFDRVFADMHHTPFIDNAFDIVFGSAILHHSKDLGEVFKEVYRVLKPGGRFILINEAARGVWEKEHPVFKQQQEKGLGDTSYTVPEFIKGAKNGGFKRVRAVFLSLADDYVTKHRNRGSKRNFKIDLAYFFQEHRWLENIILFFMLPSRMLFRPKSWKLICYKG